MASARRTLAAAALLALAGCGGSGSHPAALAATDPATGASTAVSASADPTTAAAAATAATVATPTSSAPATTTPRPSPSSASPTVRRTTPSDTCVNGPASQVGSCPRPAQPYPGPPRAPKLLSVTNALCATNKSGYSMAAWFNFDAIYAGWQIRFSDPQYYGVMTGSVNGGLTGPLPTVTVVANSGYPPVFPGSPTPPLPTSETLSGTITFSNSAGSASVPVSVTAPCRPTGR